MLKSLTMFTCLWGALSVKSQVLPAGNDTESSSSVIATATDMPSPSVEAGLDLSNYPSCAVGIGHQPKILF